MPDHKGAMLLLLAMLVAGPAQAGYSVHTSENADGTVTTCSFYTERNFGNSRSRCYTQSRSDYLRSVEEARAITERSGACNRESIRRYGTDIGPQAAALSERCMRSKEPPMALP